MFSARRRGIYVRVGFMVTEDDSKYNRISAILPLITLFFLFGGFLQRSDTLMQKIDFMLNDWTSIFGFASFDYWSFRFCSVSSLYSNLMMDCNKIKKIYIFVFYYNFFLSSIIGKSSLRIVWKRAGTLKKYLAGNCINHLSVMYYIDQAVRQSTLGPNHCGSTTSAIQPSRKEINEKDNWHFPQRRRLWTNTGIAHDTYYVSAEFSNQFTGRRVLFISVVYDLSPGSSRRPILD